MSESNGNGTADPNATGMKRILSLSTANTPKSTLTRAQRAEVEQLAHAMVIQECAKVHEHYLEQIPTFVARMVQDALLHYGLIKPADGTDIAPATDVTSPKSGADAGHSEGLPADGLGDVAAPTEPAA